MIFRKAKGFLKHGLRYLLAFSLIAMLFACADKQAVVLGPQQWQDLEFRVEVRPSPPRAGMNEFIVIASREVYKPGVGLIIKIRADEKGEWRQAIQDGFTGVYRRAVRVDDPQTQSLSMHVRRSNGDDETLLSFPLNQKPVNQKLPVSNEK
jgi:hypothetical protein